LKKIAFLEYEFSYIEESVLEIQDFQGQEAKEMQETRPLMLPRPPLSPPPPLVPRPPLSGVDLEAVLTRLCRLEYEYGWLQNSVHVIRENSGLEEHLYPRFPYRWEAPPPPTFRYSGSIYAERYPINATAKGPANHITNPTERTGDVGYWTQVGGPRVEFNSTFFIKSNSEYVKIIICKRKGLRE
jgi:hypothetical protein